MLVLCICPCFKFSDDLELLQLAFLDLPRTFPWGVFHREIAAPTASSFLFQRWLGIPWLHNPFSSFHSRGFSMGCNKSTHWCVVLPGKEPSVAGAAFVCIGFVGLVCLRVQHGRPGYTYKAWAQEVKTLDGGIFAPLPSCYPLNPLLRFLPRQPMPHLKPWRLLAEVAERSWAMGCF